MFVLADERNRTAVGHPPGPAEYRSRLLAANDRDLEWDEVTVRQTHDPNPSGEPVDEEDVPAVGRDLGKLNRAFDQPDGVAPVRSHPPQTCMRGIRGVVHEPLSVRRLLRVL